MAGSGAGSAIRIYNFCRSQPVPCKCFGNCPFNCNSSSLNIPSQSVRMTSLVNIFCKLIASNIQNATQNDLINYSAGTGAVCTIFVRSVDNTGASVFTRKYTTVRMYPNDDNGNQNGNGAYAINTTLSTTSPAYLAFVDGKSYLGLTNLFGQSYQGAYWRISGNYYVLVGNYF